MASVFEFQLEEKTYSLMIFYADPEHFYVLEDGSLLPVSVWPAWCESCQKFVAGELIHSIEDEDKELEELEYFAKHPGHIPPDRQVDLGNLPELRVRQIWRKKRTSPAKCMACGSESITSIRPEPEIEIPGRGKCVGRFGGWVDASSAGGPHKKLYTPGGDRIPSPPKQRRLGAKS